MHFCHCKHRPEDFIEMTCCRDRCGRMICCFTQRRFTIVNGCPVPSRRFF